METRNKNPYIAQGDAETRQSYNRFPGYMDVARPMKASTLQEYLNNVAHNQIPDIPSRNKNDGIVPSKTILTGDCYRDILFHMAQSHTGSPF